MRIKKISELPITTSAAQGDALIINQNGVTKQISFSDLSSMISSLVWTPGVIMTYPSLSIPNGWLECNGQSLSIASENSPYLNLFSIIGRTFGGGTNTFNVPDLRGVFIRGFDNGKGLDAGRGLGTYQVDEFKGHTHNILGTIADVGNTNSLLTSEFANVNNTTYYSSTLSSTGGTETRPKNVAMIYCIKY